MEYSTIVSVLILLTLTACSAAPATRQIRFYYDINYKGNHFTYRARSGCHNLAGSHSDSVSSIDTKGDCYLVYEHYDCKGKTEIVLPESDFRQDLSKVGLNDAISSFQLCP